MIAEFHQRLRSVIDALPYSFEVWYVNDGPRDRTEAVVIEIIRQDICVRLLNLSRNFGHQAALTAGLDFAEGQVIITMDGDGQHLPEYIKDMLDPYERGVGYWCSQRLIAIGCGW